MTLEHADIETRRLVARVATLRAMGRSIAHAAAQLLALQAWRARARRTALRLAAMEDWQLEDIGLTRAEVEQQLARHGIVRDPTSLFDCR
ncbi:DUF1127 domain-containing protein [Pelagibacterium montanilacus]|uniref:DUF1127 domain-containing protein n=1 Tax=Pelagibacterium montanilacus TaxID=2185280 RepID=UPI001FE9DF4D|nr:DUF1127 domain-containing protein [Pelagibacterium montanilacus]